MLFIMFIKARVHESKTVHECKSFFKGKNVHGEKVLKFFTNGKGYSWGLWTGKIPSEKIFVVRQDSKCYYR